MLQIIFGSTDLYICPDIDTIIYGLCNKLDKKKKRLGFGRGYL